MALCPGCQQSIEVTSEHVGALFTCPHCGAVFFIGWDGQPEELPPTDPVPEPVLFNDENTASGVVFDDEKTFTGIPLQEEPVGEPVLSPPVFESEEADAGESVGGDVGAFEEVVEYGNDSSVGGPLSYDVTIGGLEVAETRLLLREALDDSRFGWDADELMSSIEDARLVLRGLSPTKASILVSRVKSMPVEVSWEQGVYGETST